MAINKKSQAEVITVVLLVLLSVTAVVLVSSFVINLVRNNLRGTDCFDATGSLTISLADTKVEENNFYLAIERNMKEFNLSGIFLNFGSDYRTKTIKIIAPKVDGVYLLSLNGVPEQNLSLPQQGEIYIYLINSSDLTSFNITKASISPMINNRVCEKSDEKNLY